MNPDSTVTHGHLVLIIVIAALVFITVVAIYERLLDNAEADIKAAETRAYFSDLYTRDALSRLQDARIQHEANRRYATPAWAQRDRDALLNAVTEQPRPGLHVIEP